MSSLGRTGSVGQEVSIAGFLDRVGRLQGVTCCLPSLPCLPVVGNDSVKSREQQPRQATRPGLGWVSAIDETLGAANSRRPSHRSKTWCLQQSRTQTQISNLVQLSAPNSLKPSHRPQTWCSIFLETKCLSLLDQSMGTKVSVFRPLCQ